MPFDIVEGLQLPPRERARKYNIDELQPGQALVVPAGEKCTASAVYTSARKLGIKVSVRLMQSADPDGNYAAGDSIILRTA